MGIRARADQEEEHQKRGLKIEDGRLRIVVFSIPFFVGMSPETQTHA